MLCVSQQKENAKCDKNSVDNLHFLVRDKCFGTRESVLVFGAEVGQCCVTMSRKDK